ncbi:hypothetical protein M8C21_018658, partial [Ambrosia artemisiifolia]
VVCFWSNLLNTCNLFIENKGSPSLAQPRVDQSKQKQPLALAPATHCICTVPANWRVQKDDSVKENSLECGRTSNAKAATIVGEVLAMRLKVEGLESGQERGIHVDVNKELEKKDFKNRTKVWAVINSLKNNGVKLILDENNDGSHPVSS